VEVLSEGACVQAFIVRATQPVGCVRALGKAKVAQHGSLREGICVRRAAIRPLAMGNGRACRQPTAEVPNSCRAFGEFRRSASMRMHARIAISSKATACVRALGEPVRDVGMTEERAAIGARYTDSR